MKTTLFLLAFAITPAIFAQNYTPITVTGYNEDVVAEATPALTNTSVSLDGSDYVLYSQSYGSSFGTGVGLPNNGLISSASGTYQFAAYNTPNAIFLTTGQTDSLELTTPASYSSLSFAGFSTEGAGTVLLVIKFTDGTAMVVNSSNLPDWFNGSAAILNGFDRTGRINDSPDFNSFQPYIYRINVNLSCADQAKLVQRVLIVNTTPSPSVRTVILALSGAPVVNSAAILDYQDVSCFGETDGFIQLTPAGLTPLSFSWNTTPVSTTQNLNSAGAGNYTCTITDATGCSTQVSQILTEPAEIGFSQTVSICSGESFTVGPYTHTTSGTYHDPLPSSSGCDSMITTVLTVVSINNSVTLSGHQLSAVASGAQYQWLDCGGGYAPVPGAVNQTFSPDTDGAYAVAVTVNNCTDTSSCVIYSTVGIEELPEAHITLAPNPVKDLLNIHSDEPIRSVEVFNVAGKTQLISVLDNNTLDMSGLSEGVYILKIATETGRKNTLRVVKQ